MRAAACTAGLLAFRPLPAQTIKFTTLTREIIEQRLDGFATTNARREAKLVELFAAAGCSGAALTTQKVKGQNTPNLICTASGGTDSAIIAGAHFDLTGGGDGVADNWSGAALLPSLYQSLAGEKRRHTFIYIAFTGEEKGLLGSRFYVKQMTEEQSQRVRAMINFDTLGLSSTKVWLSHADRSLAASLAPVAAAMKLPVAAVDVDRVGTSDSESFRLRRIPSITIHSVTQETLPILHSTRDRLDRIRMDEYYDTYRLMAAWCAYLDQKLD